MLKNTTLHHQFNHWSVSSPPEIKGFPVHGSAYFNPYSYGNSKFGIKAPGGNNPGVNHLYYTPPIGFIGRDTIEVYYYRTLGNGNVVSAYKVLNILVVNSYLDALNDFASTTEGQSVEIAVLANDTGNGTEPVIASIPNVNSGIAVPVAGGTKIKFDPAPGFIGLANLNYTICDLQGTCDMATVSICVNPASPPVYDSIFVTTNKNAAQVLLMQIDSSFEVILPPANGDLITMQTMAYKPDLNFTGIDKVIFENPANGQIRVAVIKVLDVNGPNTLLFDDVVYTPMNTNIDQIRLLDNDNGGTYLMNVGIVGGDYTTDNGGTLTPLYSLGKGIYKYEPSANFQGLDHFSYRATAPGSGVYETADCFIVVDNQQPVEAVFHLTTPKNTPLVLGDHLPFAEYGYGQINQGNKGWITFYPGFATVTSAHGQVFSGFNMLVYDPQNNVTGSDVFEFTYCAGNQVIGCPLVKVEVEIENIANPQEDVICAGRECVWSGDANHDGSVDVRDILPIGLTMGEVGQLRQNGSLSWYGQYSSNWNSLYATGLGYDVKHTDTDGDGIVSSLDTTAIGLFYGKYNNLTPEPVESIENLPFYIQEPDFSNISPGDVIYAPIYLGNENFPAVNAYGLTFELSYDPAFFQAVNIVFNDHSWMNYNSPTLAMAHKPFAGKVDAGFTRTSGQAASGYGIIGVAEFIVIDDISGTRLKSNSTTVNFKPLGLMSGSGSVQNTEGNSFTLSLNAGSIASQGNANDDQLVVFPNPATESVNVHLNGGADQLMERIQLYSLTGGLVYDSGTAQAKNVKLDVSQLAIGIYSLKVTTQGEVLSKKIEIIR